MPQTVAEPVAVRDGRLNAHARPGWGLPPCL